MRGILKIVTATAFLLNALGPVPAWAGEMVMPLMPKPGTMVSLSPSFEPAHLQGITIHPDNALKFDFLIHRGQGNLDEAQKKQEYNKLIKYFLASLTVPDKDQWVNLSPFEKDRIIENNFGKTEMGRDLLAQDYLLKQITSSLMYPETGLGKVFWEKVYKKAYEEYGATTIPVNGSASLTINTFNKVWIIPDEAAVYESGNTVYILRNHLKVMLEEDYLALGKGCVETRQCLVSTKQTNNLGSGVIRDVILPAIEKEVNEGKNFAQLRQIYSGMILATWYKHALKESLLGKVYANKAKVKGVNQDDPKANDVIYQEYLVAFKKGVYNYIKEDFDPHINQTIPHKYFAGGAVSFAMVSNNAALGFQDATLIRIKSPSSIPPPLLGKVDFAGLSQNIDQATVALKVSAQVTEHSAYTDAAMSEDGRKKRREELNKQVKAMYRLAGIYDITKHLGKVFVRGLIPIQFVLPNGRQWGRLQSLRLGGGPFSKIEMEMVLEDGRLMGVYFIGHFEKNNIREINRSYWRWQGDNFVLQDQLNKWSGFESQMRKIYRGGGVIDLSAYLGKAAVQRGLLKHTFMLPHGGQYGDGRKRRAGYVRLGRYNFSRMEMEVTVDDRNRKEIWFIGYTKTAGKERIFTKSQWLWDKQESLLFLWSGKVGNKAGSLATAKVWSALRTLGGGKKDIIFYLKTGMNPNQRINLRDAVIDQNGSLSDEEFDVFEAEFIEGKLVSEVRMEIADPQQLLAIRASVVKRLAKMKQGEHGIIPRDIAERQIPLLSNDEVWSLVESIRKGDIVGIPSEIWKEFQVIAGAVMTSSEDKAQIGTKDAVGGIDMNSASLNLLIKRNGKGVPLPLVQQDMAQLDRIQGFDPSILKIIPVTNLPILSELREKLR